MLCSDPTRRHPTCTTGCHHRWTQPMLSVRTYELGSSHVVVVCTICCTEIVLCATLCFWDFNKRSFLINSLLLHHFSLLIYSHIQAMTVASEWKFSSETQRNNRSSKHQMAPPIQYDIIESVFSRNHLYPSSQLLRTAVLLKDKYRRKHSNTLSSTALNSYVPAQTGTKLQT